MDLARVACRSARRRAIAAAACLLAATGAASGQQGAAPDADGERGDYAVAVTGESKLAPELVAAKLTGGRVVARTEDGLAVVVQEELSAQELVAIEGVTEAAPVAETDRLDPIDNRIIVLFEPGRAPEDAEIEAAGLRVVDRSEEGSFAVVILPGTTAEDGIVPEAVESLERLLDDEQQVRYIEPDYVVSVPQPAEQAEGLEDEEGRKAPDLSAAAIPNDPGFGQLWGMTNIRAPRAWDVVKTSPVVVAVIDTGVDYKHEDLIANMWKNPGEIPGNGIDDDGNGLIDDVFGADYVNNDGDPMDDNRHGTHCAGTVGAVGDNGKGVVGVNWGVKIMALKFLSGSGSGSTSNAIKCIDYAIKKKARIMNNSWGGGGYSQALADAIKRAENAKILFVAAAGNSGTNNDASPHYPSSYANPNVIAVLSIDQADTKSSFSCLGKKSVDLGAPGGKIYSTVPTSMAKYATLSGTSMATPHVSGAAALVLGHPSYKAAPWNKVRDVLYRNVRKLPDLKDKCVTGGTLDIGFLKGALGGAEALAGGYVDFGKVRIEGNRTIASATVELGQASFVRITALGTARMTSAGSARTVISGLSVQDAPTTIFTNSLRRNQAAGAGSALPLSTSFGLRLGPGRHTIRWNVWPFGAVLETDSGTLEVDVVGDPTASQSPEEVYVSEVTDDDTIRRRVTIIEVEQP